MDPITHVLFSAILFNKLDPALVFGSVLPDLDHIYSYLKGNLRSYRSRTPLHELPALSFLIAISSFLNPSLSLGLISHAVLDFITGDTRPFYPFHKGVVRFNLPAKLKVLLAVIVWAIGLAIILL